MPFFSVLIPSYNRPEYVPQAVASVLASHDPDFELIVSDDCSPRQKEIVAALAPYANDPRLIVVPQTTNLGEARNRHFLMERACGEYRIILGDDDQLAPQALATLRRTISERPHYDIYLFGYSIIDEVGRIVETRRALRALELSLGQDRVLRDLFYSDFFPFWFYHPATFCFPASLHRDVKPNHSVGIGDDLVFVFDAMLAHKRALIVPEVLFSYRKFIGPRPYQQTNLSQTVLADVLTRRNILYDLLSRKNLPEPLQTLICSRDFRERFLYNRIMIDADATTATLAELKLTPAHLAEVQAYWGAKRRRWFPHWLQFQRVLRFAGYFGLAGLLEAYRVGRQRRFYRRHIARA
jgi:glycosyltransferase involved in cell wall biosynthesis